MFKLQSDKHDTWTCQMFQTNKCRPRAVAILKDQTFLKQEKKKKIV